MDTPGQPTGVGMDEAQIKTAVVREAYRYWCRKQIDGRPPRRADIVPEEIPRLLPFLFLVDVLHAPLGFRFRLVGTRIGVWAGREYTGVALNEREYGPSWQRVFDQYAEVVATRAPRRDEYRSPWVARGFVYYERLVAPLSSDGAAIDMLFGALHVLPAPEGA
jgi:hypothetical protein